jgi:hypothetical protein
MVTYEVPLHPAFAGCWPVRPGGQQRTLKILVGNAVEDAEHMPTLGIERFEQH